MTRNDFRIGLEFYTASVFDEYDLGGCSLDPENYATY